MKDLSVGIVDGCGCGGGAAWPLEMARKAATDLPRAVAEVETLSLAGALGRILAEPVITSVPLPRFDHSAMDGYAVRRADLRGEGPWQLAVSQRVAAGQAPAPLAMGTAAQVFTGAPLPSGADAVIMQEHVTTARGGIFVTTRPAPGSHIRTRGEEMAEGSAVLSPGKRLTSRDIALAASAGVATVSVARPVRVALLTTGDELRQPGESLNPGQITDVNTAMLSAAMARPDVTLSEIRHVPDTRADHLTAMAAAFETADLVITTGGVSVGEEDHVRAAFQTLGGRVEVPAINLKPGKPVAFGTCKDALWLGLPGNPMSAFVTFALFGQPILSALGGCTEPSPQRYAASANDMTRRPGRSEVRPASDDGQDELGRLRLQIGDAVHSGRMSPLANADGMAILPAEADRIAAGDLVEFISFERGI